MNHGLAILLVSLVVWSFMLIWQVGKLWKDNSELRRRIRILEKVLAPLLFKSILDRIEIIGTDGQGLFMIDQEISRMAAAKTVAGPDEAQPA